MSTERSGFVSVESGFIAPRTTSGQPSVELGRVHGGDLDDVRVHRHPQRAQEGLAQPTAGHARRRLACRGTLEDVAHVALLVLVDSHQVGMSGARQVDLIDLLLHRPRAHALAPVGVVAVDDLQRDGPAERVAVADPAGDLGAVALDLHAPATTVAELAAGHVGVEILGRHLQAGRQALDDARQAGTMRLAGGYEAEGHGPSLLPGPARELPWRARR